MKDGAGTTEDGDSSLASVVDSIGEAGHDGEVTVNEVLEAFADRSLGVLLAALGFIAALPIVGGIPGITILLGALILLALASDVISGANMRLPDVVGKRATSEATMGKALEKARPWAERIDRLLKPRLTQLTNGTAARYAFLGTTALMAATFFPLAVVPYGVMPASLSVLALGLARMTRDGYAAALGYVLAVATLGVLWASMGLIGSTLG